MVTAKEAGEYRVEVSPASPRARPGKYSITLKQVRPSVAEDFVINEASAKILTLAQEATVQKYKGTFEGTKIALEKWDEAIKVSKIKKDRVWEGVALVGKGLIYETIGEPQKALEAYLESLEIWQVIDNRQYKASSINNIGSVYSDLGEHKKAIGYYQQAEKLQRDVGDMDSVATYLNNIGFSYMRLEDYEKAEKFLKEAAEIHLKNTSVRGKRSLGYTLNNLGANFLRQGEDEEGIEYLQKSLEVRKDAKHRWGISNSLLNLGKAQWKTGRREEGLKKLTDANRLSGELGDRIMEAQSFYLLARAEKDLGNVEKAITHIDKGLKLIEQVRSSLVSSQSRYTYFSTVQNYYELYIDLLVTRAEKNKNKEDIRLALQINERSRSRSLVELLQEARVNFRQGVDVRLLQTLKTLQRNLNDKYTSRQRLLGRAAKPEQITRVNNEINDLNTEIENLRIRIRRENPKYADLTEGKTISAREIQSLLDEKSVLIQYKLGDKRSFAWLITKSEIEIFKLPSRRKIEEKAKTFYSLILANKREEQDQTVQLSKELGKILLAPIIEKVADKRLTIVADGILQYTPFSALLSPKSGSLRLIETNEIVMLPSASVLAQLRANRKPGQTNGKTIAIFADPVFDKRDSRIGKTSAGQITNKNVGLTSVMRDFKLGETLPRLIASRQEARGISNILEKNNATVKLDFQANLKNIENSDLTQYRILHFATHGLLNTSRPELSGLVFSLYDKNGEPQEGFLSLNDIYNLNLASDMIVLSACQTALGKEVRGEGLIGLSRGFLYAGSNRIIASLWKVDDSATAEFMKRFYKNHLQKGMPASSALRETKLEMKNIRRYRSPFYWSAFTLLGDWK